MYYIAEPLRKRPISHVLTSKMDLKKGPAQSTMCDPCLSPPGCDLTVGHRPPQVSKGPNHRRKPSGRPPEHSLIFKQFSNLFLAPLSHRCQYMSTCQPPPGRDLTASHWPPPSSRGPIRLAKPSGAPSGHMRTQAALQYPVLARFQSSTKISVTY